MSGEGISIVIPFYNEEPNLEPLCAQLIPVLCRTGRPFEVLLIDDGSTDGGSELAEEIASRELRIRIFHIEKRSGQSAAFDAGFRAVRFPLTITMDADLQNDPEDIPVLLQALKDTDVVSGIRVRRQDSLVRRISGWIANRVRDWITGDRVTDTGCSLRLYRSRYLGRLKMYRGLHRFLPTLLKDEGARVIEIPVRHRPRVAGKSKYGIRNRALSGLRDCLAVRWMRDRKLDYRIREEGR
jgi:glycosyltransferase involved in cell wall biosynthesis